MKILAPIMSVAIGGWLLLLYKRLLKWNLLHTKTQNYDFNKLQQYECSDITKTRLFKYIENFISKNWKFSDKKLWYFFIFLFKT